MARGSKNLRLLQQGSSEQQPGLYGTRPSGPAWAYRMFRIPKARFWVEEQLRQNRGQGLRFDLPKAVPLPSSEQYFVAYNPLGQSKVTRTQNKIPARYMETIKVFYGFRTRDVASAPVQNMSPNYES